MKYKIGDVVGLVDGKIFTIDIIDSDENDLIENRGFFEYINE